MAADFTVQGLHEKTVKKNTTSTSFSSSSGFGHMEL